MKLFNEAIKRLEEINCWKGYRKVGTKIKGGKRVNDCKPLKEVVRHKLHSSFNDLPDTPPHGFWITKDGKFVPVYRMFGHDDALKDLFPEIVGNKSGSMALYAAMKTGMIRVVKMPGNNYGITYHPIFLKNPTAKKTAKDIADFYNMGIVDDLEGL